MPVFITTASHHQSSPNHHPIVRFAIFDTSLAGSGAIVMDTYMAQSDFCLDPMARRLSHCATALLRHPLKVTHAQTGRSDSRVSSHSLALSRVQSGACPSFRLCALLTPPTSAIRADCADFLYRRAGRAAGLRATCPRPFTAAFPS